jgi:hypothetical protein
MVVGCDAAPVRWGMRLVRVAEGKRKGRTGLRVEKVRPRSVLNGS